MMNSSKVKKNPKRSCYGCIGGNSEMSDYYDFIPSFTCEHVWEQICIKREGTTIIEVSVEHEKL